MLRYRVLEEQLSLYVDFGQCKTTPAKKTDPDNNNAQPRHDQRYGFIPRCNEKNTSNDSRACKYQEF